MKAAAVLTVTEERRHPPLGESNSPDDRENRTRWTYRRVVITAGPVHTVPSEVDRARTRCRTVPFQNHTFRKVLDFASMFSEHPNYAVRVDPADPGPAFAAPDQLRWTQQPQTGKNQQTWQIKECRVTGADYWKYFKRPLNPSSHQLLPHVVFAQEDLEIPGQQPTHFTVGVQTDYRESETQTDPYSPGYVIRRGATASELLQLAALSWGRGLPAGLDEVEMIEWGREKQAWEARLPPLDDKSQLKKRRRMLEEILAKEWALRDGKIQKLQEARLALLKDQLRRRHEAQENATFQRINHMYAEYEEEKETRLQKIHNDYLRSLRKLEAKRKTAEGKRLDIVTEFQRYVLTDRRTNKSGSQNSLTNKGEQIQAELHQSVPKPGIKIHKPKIANNPNQTRVGKAVDLLLDYKAQIEEKTPEKKRPLRFLVKKKKLTPVSAREKSPPQSEEQTELAVIVLQKILRGRRMQHEMCEGVEDSRDFMRELRTVHSIHSEEQELLKADKELVMRQKDQRDRKRQKASEEEAVHRGVVGAEQELLFDTLSKEMVRLQEERRLHAFALLADRERRRREAEESGRRQEEERRRREEDEIFRQVVQVHQQSVDMYLEDIILETLDKMSHEKAREEIQEKLKELNEIAYAMEKSLDERQSEEIVSELLHSHLIPGVEKSIFWQNVRRKQRKHLQAAQSVIQEIIAPGGALSTAPRSTSPGATSSIEGEEDLSRPETAGHQE
uniref:Cilia- and flagella-associated protein 91 n=1 Tax=Oryzias latipes TaxID=8090 RepID=A0A3P9L1L3_ORYLA